MTWPDASSGDDYEPVPLFMNERLGLLLVRCSDWNLAWCFVGLVMRRIHVIQ